MRRALPALWSLLLAVLMLWPALGSGFVLTYDMVWVPDLAMRPDFLGLGSALPRAVPSDAVVAVLDEVVPGMLLQKLVLLGSLVLGGTGAAHLAPRRSWVAQLVAVSLFCWNPFVVERLVIGHWPVLVGYAALPWLVVAARSARESQRFPWVLGLLLPMSALSASAGLMAVVVTLAFGLGARGRTNAALVLAVVAANAPWWVTGLLHVGEATTDPAGSAAFALRGVGSLPGPVAALGLGGVWNTEVVPDSRTGALGVVALVAVLVLCAVGFRSWRRAHSRRDVIAFSACWALGWGTAVLTWAVPDAMGELYSTVSGTGVVRDGSRLLALCAPLLVALSAHGAQVLRDRAGDFRPARASAGIGLVLLPVAVLPDAALGASGAIGTADYPASYERAREVVDRARDLGQPGDVVVLPFTSYRAPDWNAGRKVLDPLGRYLSPDFVVSDDLVVSGRLVPGEDPRAEAVRAALSAGTPRQRAGLLADLGIGFVVIDRPEVHEDLPERLAPDVAGTRHTAGSVEVVVLEDVTSPARVGGVRAWLAGLAWVAFLGLLLVGVAGGVRRLVSRGS